MKLKHILAETWMKITRTNTSIESRLKSLISEYGEKISSSSCFDRCRGTKFDCVKFNPREAAYAFLRQYDQASFVRGQKVSRYEKERIRRMNFDRLRFRTMVENCIFMYGNCFVSEFPWICVGGSMII